LAVDQGTTGSTALVFSQQGEVLGRAYARLSQHYPQPGWVEHSPEEIFSTSLAVMTEALANAGIDGADLAAVGITNQRETTVVWDRRTGEPVHPAIVWQSRQTAEICESLCQAGHEETFRQKTGLVVDAYFSGTKARWIFDRYPDAWRAAVQGDVLFGTVDTWLLWKLTGGAVHATEPTNASRTLLYNIHDQAWDGELLDILGVPEATLPEVKPSSGVFGETVAFEGLPAGIPIAGMAGDQQAALYGQGCWEAGQAKNTYGTGCFLLMNMGRPGEGRPAAGTQAPVSQHGLLTTLCCDAKGRVAYALEGSVFVAGAAVQWLRDEMGLISDAAESEAIAAGLASNDGVYLVPAFTGLGAPYWDADARGTLVGLTRGTGRAHVVRAALEAIAYQTRDIVDAMNADCGVPLTELRADGGASANDFLMQFQADLLNVPVDRPELVETTAAGSAFLAGLAVGFWRGPEDLRSARKRQRLFLPGMPRKESQALYDGWRRAVERAVC
jgi:glycerol kinase